MHPFFLTFKDANIEESYQIKNQHSKRLLTFISISSGFILAFLIKVIQSISEDNMYAFYLNITILSYLCLQLGFFWKKNKYLRLGIIILNHFVTIYFIVFEDRSEVDNQMAMLQGVNQMAASYLLILTGEYLDGMLTIISLQIFRISWVLVKSESIQYSAPIASLLLILYINYYNFLYNKAKRSQYLLTLADCRWEEILQKLQIQQSYMILQFQEETLRYTIKNFRNCEKMFKTQEEAENFLRLATHHNNLLQNIIHKNMIEFKKTTHNNFNETILINYQKQTIRTEISIYKGDQPTILLIFRNFFLENKINPISIQKQFGNAIKLIVKILEKIRGAQFFEIQYLMIQRKLILVHLMINVQNKLKIKTININDFINHAILLYQDLKIKLNYKCNAKIETIVSILQILIILIFENRLSDILSITTKMTSDEYVQCIFQGRFNLDKLIRFKKAYELPWLLIFETLDLDEEILTFTFHKNIGIPFGA
ncbi:unnamed protein product [Paramecium pentaurelia]|uniref:Transmembrane protein n=1 Tax=Paramecium pentaurelia TaxID=43138 RepID=A0A8S1XXT3_9CILI|nr:unnamed protein product [Paramecium pentaurelia]